MLKAKGQEIDTAKLAADVAALRQQQATDVEALATKYHKTVPWMMDRVSRTNAPSVPGMHIFTSNPWRRIQVMTGFMLVFDVF